MVVFIYRGKGRSTWFGLAWLSHEKLWQYIWARIHSTVKATWMVTMPSYPIHRGRSRRPSRSIRAQPKDFDRSLAFSTISGLWLATGPKTLINLGVIGAKAAKLPADQ